jgi:GTP-binding protein Era
MNKKKEIPYKFGYAAIVGRPNVGKSTLLNNLIQHKVAMVSSKPQTTRSQIMAYFEDDRGQIFFLDTPGLYLTKRGTGQFNGIIPQSLSDADVILYVVDHTKKLGHEDQQVWQQILAADKPVMLVINKTDITEHSHKPAYLKLVGDQVVATVETSALRRQHLKAIINHLFELLPPGERNQAVDSFVTPLLSHSSHEYLAETIQEKIFEHTDQEVPYQTSVTIISGQEDEIKNRLTIKAEINVPAERYKSILIGKQGRKIKQIGTAVRHELQIATGKQIVVKLNVVVRRL